MNIINLFQERKSKQQKISMVTAYDASMARIIARSEIDCILVGDSLGMVFQGHHNTLPVTLEQMIYHARAVKKGCSNKPIICDMPFLSYQVSIEEGVAACGKVFKETGCEAIKVEGGSDFICQLIERLTEIGIPAMGHLGLTPQAYHTLGGHRLQGRDSKDVRKIHENAAKLEAAGAFSLVLEMVPEALAQGLIETIQIPIIGIGAGRVVDGQVLVINDILGMDSSFQPKFLKRYAHLEEIIHNALNQYNQEVKETIFPADENIYP